MIVDPITQSEATAILDFLSSKNFMRGQLNILLYLKNVSLIVKNL